MSTVNCPNCGVGNHLLPNMRKPKCRKCGKLITSSGESPKKIEKPPEAAAPKTPEKVRKPAKAKTSKTPKKIEESPETPKVEVQFVADYEV